MYFIEDMVKEIFYLSLQVVRFISLHLRKFSNKKSRVLCLTIPVQSEYLLGIMMRLVLFPSNIILDLTGARRKNICVFRGKILFRGIFDILSYSIGKQPHTMKLQSSDSIDSGL